MEAFPLPDPGIIAGLKAELPSYLAKTADVSPDLIGGIETVETFPTAWSGMQGTNNKLSQCLLY